MYFAAGGRKRTIKPYDRDKAVRYAHRWAYERNPAYYDFEKLGGDCTNFASQCIYAGSGIMNHTPVYGWYYINAGLFFCNCNVGFILYIFH
ncbi:MAG TPA: amidase domain-containing protein, partial [Clostridiales bacterium]|nr:amidase domain-containing protein [Clostridiales bacterium]